MEITKTIDARGSFCPGPLMEMIRAIKEGNTGDIIAVLSTESGSKADIPAWAEKAGQEYVGAFDEDGVTKIVVKKIK